MKSDRIAGIVVRRARRADVPRLAALYHQLHLDSYSETEVPPVRMLRAFDALAADRRHTILLAEEGAELIGTAHVIVVAHLGHGLAPMAIVENAVVDEAARSRGVGELLMRHAAAIARQAKCYKLCLTTNIRRLRAHRFYQRLGWRRTHFGYSLDLTDARGRERAARDET